MRRLATALLLLCAACQGRHTAASRVSATDGPTTAPAVTTAAPASRTPSPTPSARPSPTTSPTPSPTPRPTPRPTPSPTRSPRPSPTPVRTPSPKPSPTPTPSPTAKGTTHTLHMVTGDRFSPSSITIAVGDSVRVVNDDTNHHTWTDSGTWDSGDLGQSASYTYRFTKAGTFDFVCSYHEAFGMTGRVTVH